jgi:hypothetical protein
MRAEPLLRLADALGLDRARLVEAEGPSRLAGTFEVAGTAAARLTPALFEALACEYGEALSLRIRTGDLDEVVYDGRRAPPSLATFSVGAGRTPSYDVVLVLDKARLAERLVGAGHGAVVRLYVTVEAAVAALQRPVPFIERELWGRTASRLVLAVLDHDVHLVGAAVSVVGGRHLGSIEEEVARPPDLPAWLGRAIRRRDDLIGWDGGLATSLTPWHLRRCGGGVVDDPVAAQLDGLFVALAVLYTCDRARALGGGDGPSTIRAEFRGGAHVAFVPLPSGPALAGLPDQDRAAVGDLLDWCYEGRTADPDGTDWLGDRLPFVQLRVARLLEHRPEATRLRAFAAAMPEIHEGAQWHWRSFLEGRVADELDRMQRFEGIVAEAVDRTAEQTGALTRNLTDAMLAAVGAVIGSMIAATFHGPFDDRLFRVGMVTYAAYLVVFPGLVGLMSNRGRAAEVARTFEVRRRRFASVLLPDEIEALVGSRVTDACRRHHRWLVAVGACYVLAAVAAAVGALVVPGLVGGAPP